MLTVMHSHFWDGEEGGGGDPVVAQVSGYIAFQSVIIRATFVLALLLVG